MLALGQWQRAARVRSLSRERFGRPRSDVEQQIARAISGLAESTAQRGGMQKPSRQRTVDVDEE
jgi:hypothetical protein